jgi:hypothetical protein
MKQRGLTNYALAHKMKGNPDTIRPKLTLILTGKRKQVHFETFFSIANAFEIPIEEILGKDYSKQF